MIIFVVATSWIACRTPCIVNQGIEFAKELWEALENKYMSKNGSSKNILVIQFNNYKMVKERSILDQLHEIQSILSHLKKHNLHMDKTIVMSSIVDKLSPS